MNSESLLYQEFHKRFHERYETANYHWTRIESNYTNQGVPDVNICIWGKEFWIEFKYGTNKLNPLQISWIAKRRAAGGLVFFIRQRKEAFYTVEWYGLYHKVDSIDKVIDIIIAQIEEK